MGAYVAARPGLRRGGGGGDHAFDLRGILDGAVDIGAGDAAVAAGALDAGRVDIVLEDGALYRGR
jgi:hypothetical protein